MFQAKLRENLFNNLKLISSSTESWVLVLLLDCVLSLGLCPASYGLVEITCTYHCLDLVYFCILLSHLYIENENAEFVFINKLPFCTDLNANIL